VRNKQTRKQEIMEARRKKYGLKKERQTEKKG
jgi:hypothetical protein